MLCKTHDHGVVYTWDFLFNIVTQKNDDDGYSIRIKDNCYINSDNFVIPMANEVANRKEITFKYDAILQRDVDDEEYQNIGDRIILVSEEGLLFAGYSGPLDKLVTLKDEFTGVFPSKDSKQIVYKPGTVRIPHLGVVNCMQIFPPFKFS